METIRLAVRSRLGRAVLGTVLVLMLSTTSFAAYRVRVTVGPDPALPGELLDLEITVTNDGPFDGTDLTVLLDIPANLNTLFDGVFDGDCAGTTCDLGEQAQFLIPSLPADEGLTLTVPARVGPTVSDGTTISFDVDVLDNAVLEAEATGGVTVDSGRELELALVEQRDPVAPGQLLTYSVTFGVLETSAGSPDATLRLPLPAGTTFVAASHGGSLNAGAVEWVLGNLNPGTVGERQATLQVDAGTELGAILTAQATFADATSASTSYPAATRVQADLPLELLVVAGPDPAIAGELLDLELTVSNDGPFDRTGVTLQLEVPEGLTTLFDGPFDGDCAGTTCDVTERVLFTLGTLSAGEGLTFSVPARIASVAPDGTVLSFQAIVQDAVGDSRAGAASVAVDSTRELELALQERTDPVARGGSLDYRLTFGLLETSSGAVGTMLRLPVPIGTTFVSASDGGTLNGGVVEWALGALNPGTSGERTATVQVDAGLDVGTIVVAEATFVDGASNETRYPAAGRVQDDEPLQLDVIAGPDPATAGELLDVEARVTNAGPFERTGVQLRVEVPENLNTLFDGPFDGDCAGTTCDVTEYASFDIGTLAAGAARTFTVPMRIATTAADGTVFSVEATVSDVTGGFREAGSSLAVDDTRTLDLALTAWDEPVLPGGIVTYTLTYGTFDTGPGALDARLTFAMPQGTSFVSATDGGSPSGDTVEWLLGPLNPGVGGDRGVTVLVDALTEPGTLLQAEARVDDLAASFEQVRYQDSRHVVDDAPLIARVRATPNPVPAGGAFTVFLSVTNQDSFDRNLVTLRLDIPQHLATVFDSTFDGECAGTTCDVTERAAFNIGTLAPGATVSFQVPLTVAGNAVDGTVINFDAYVTDGLGFVTGASDAVMVGSDFDVRMGDGAGGVPNGAGEGGPLLVDRLAGGELVLSWGDSCVTSDADYAVYEGTLGDFTSHAPVQCSTGGATTATISPGAGSHYYLVVPQNAIHEGSYGADSDGVERPVATPACLPREITNTCQ